MTDGTGTTYGVTEGLSNIYRTEKQIIQNAYVKYDRVIFFKREGCRITYSSHSCLFILPSLSASASANVCTRMNKESELPTLENCRKITKDITRSGNRMPGQLQLQADHLTVSCPTPSKLQSPFPSPRNIQKSIFLDLLRFVHQNSKQELFETIINVEHAQSISINWVKPIKQ